MKSLLKFTVIALVMLIGHISPAKDNLLLNFAKNYKGAGDIMHRAYLSKKMPKLTFTTPKGKMKGTVISWGSQDISVIYSHDDDHLYFFKKGAFRLNEITQKQIHMLKNKTNRWTASKVKSDELNSKFVKTVPRNFGDLFNNFNSKSPNLKIGYMPAFDAKSTYKVTSVLHANSSQVFYSAGNKLNMLPYRDILFVGVPVKKNWFKRYKSKFK